MAQGQPVTNVEASAGVTSMSALSQGAQISPDQLTAMLIGFFGETRPRWAQLAIARLLHVGFPAITTQNWFRLLKTPQNIFEELSKDDLPWLLGRVSRALAEMREFGVENLPFLQQLPWLFTFDPKTNALGGGAGVGGALALILEDVLKQPVRDQLAFWKAFARGFETPLAPRPQDRKAIVIYVVLVLNWREAEKHENIRALYGYVQTKIPKESCPAGTDEIDFEERQLKWFEKLCNRNLGLRLAKRGRPRKIPQSSEPSSVLSRATMAHR